MTRFDDAQRARWQRPNAHLYVRPDAHRFLRPDTKRFLRQDWKRFVQPGFVPVFLSLLEGKANFNPSQPRVPKGNPDGGQWTAEGGGGDSGSGDSGRSGGVRDSRILSDANPDNEWRSGAQYASNSRGPTAGRGPVIINGRQIILTPGQAAALAAAEARAEAAIAKVQNVLPEWKPTPSLYQTVEGRIAAARAEAVQAEAFYRELQSYGIVPGQFARESIPARGPERNFTAEEIRANNYNGTVSGCHICGTFEPGTRSGNHVLDHQQPTALNPPGRQQRLYPSCVNCSARQGGWIARYLRSKK